MSSRFRLAEPRFVADLIDGDALAVDLVTGSYHVTSGWSAAIFWALTQGATVSETMRLLDTPHDVGAEIEAFRAAVVELEIVVLRDGEPANPPTVDRPSGPWTALEVESHGDMADMILLDPVHEVDPEAGWPRRS